MALAIIISLTLVVATVLFHYEALRLVSAVFDAAPSWTPDRGKILVAVVLIFFIHVCEIGVYALGFWFADVVANIGSFAGAREAGVFDYFYFAAETFSSLGFGDIYPLGPLRLVASIEPINGLLLIGWSTSFSFLGMQRSWVNMSS